MNNELKLSLQLATKLVESRKNLISDISSNEDMLKRLKENLSANADDSISIGVSLKKLALKMSLFSDEEISKYDDFEEIIEYLRERTMSTCDVFSTNVIEFPSIKKVEEYKNKEYKITLSDLVENSDETDDETNDEITLIKAVNDVLNSITLREKSLLSLRFGIGDVPSREILDVFAPKLSVMTYEWVGIEHGGGLSSQAVGRIIRKAVKKLRHPTNAHNMQKFCISATHNGEERLVGTLFGLSSSTN